MAPNHPGLGHRVKGCEGSVKATFHAKQRRTSRVKGVKDFFPIPSLRAGQCFLTSLKCLDAAKALHTLHNSGPSRGQPRRVPSPARRLWYVGGWALDYLSRTREAFESVLLEVACMCQTPGRASFVSVRTRTRAREIRGFDTHMYSRGGSRACARQGRDYAG